MLRRTPLLLTLALPAALSLGGPLSAGTAAASLFLPQGVDLGLTAEQAARQGPDGLSYAEALKRSLIYTAGARRQAQVTVAALMDNLKEEWRAQGKDLSHLTVSDQTVEERIQKAVESVRQRDESIDFWATIEATGNTPESYREEVRRTLTLDKMFFPDDPELWPMEILAEVFGKDQENSMYDTVVPQTREKFAESKEKGEPPLLDDLMMQLIIRPYMYRWMYERYKIEEPFHGLPEGVALRVGKVEIKTDDLLAKCAGLIGPVELERAATWVELQWRLQEELAKRELLLSPAECLAMIEEEKKEYANSPITYEQVAIEFLGFPSMEAYRQHYRLRRSFRRSLEDPFTKETLQAHLDSGRASFLGDGKVDAEVILCAAINMKNGLMLREGDPFAAAEARARRASAELAEGADWNAVLLKYSDLPDRTPGAAPQLPQPNRGRLGVQGRNPLRQFLSETDYTDFLLGTSVGDLMFFQAEPGNIYGPVKGTVGWYVYKVSRRLPPARTLDVESDPRHTYLAGDDYLTVQFLKFVDQVMTATDQDSESQ